jgi:hypothetical protein
MTDLFPEWSAQLAADGVGPRNMPAITRGLAHSVTFSLGGDYSGAAFTMKLKAAPDALTPLAEFTCTTGAFAGGVTPVVLALPVSAQTILPTDTDANGIETLVYDILCDPVAGEPYRILGGYQPISGGVS